MSTDLHDLMDLGLHVRASDEKLPLGENSKLGNWVDIKGNKASLLLWEARDYPLPWA